MTDTIKVYEPETIQDAPLPGQDQQYSDASTTTSGGVTSPAKISNNDVPRKRIAVELLSQMLNTKSKKVLGEFELVDSGGFRIGKQQNGVSGELTITPEGITALNKAGITTFAILGEDGSAVFAGEVQAGTFISGLVVVGDNRIVIDGENKRIVINDGVTDRVLIGFQDGGF